MSNLRSALNTITSQFIDNVLAAMRNASLQDIAAETGARSTSTSTTTAAPKRRAGRKPAAAAEAAAPAAEAPAKARGGRSSARKGGRLARRSPEDLAKVVDQIVAVLDKHPDGLRAEEIREAIGVSAKELPRPLGDALDGKRITKKGQKRATTYFARRGK